MFEISIDNEKTFLHLDRKERMRILLTLITLVCLTGVSWGQQNNKPNVWVIDQTPNNFGDFYDSFVKTLRALRIGNRMKVVQSFDEPNRKSITNDVYVNLISVNNSNGGGFAWNVLWGYYDSCGNTVYENTRFGYWSGYDNHYGKSAGYEVGNLVVEWILGRDGFR
jgi:hypothetical protein